MELVENIGRGGFGSVHIANYEGQRVACKIGGQEKIKEPSLEDLKEILILADLKHPGIITVYGFAWNENTQEIWIVMDLMSEGSLKKFVFENKLKIKQKVDLMLQCAYSIKRVHTSKILHLDVKASNFLCKRMAPEMLSRMECMKRKLLLLLTYIHLEWLFMKFFSKEILIKMKKE